MKKQIITIATALLMASCSSNANQANNANQNPKDSSQIQEEKVEEKAVEPVKEEKNIAKEIFDLEYKEIVIRDNQNENVTVRANYSLGNRLYVYNTTLFEDLGEDEGMRNNFGNLTLACFPKGNDWVVVKLGQSELSSGDDLDSYLYFYEYKDGKLNPINALVDKNIFEEEYNANWDEEYLCFKSYSAIMALNENGLAILRASGEKSSGKAFAWNGSKFEVSKNIDQILTTEEELFNKVANQNQYLKGKEISISFDRYECGWENFEVDGNNFSYGRYQIEGGYTAYLAVEKGEKNVEVFKYTYQNGQLKDEGKDAILKDLSLAKIESMSITSNPFNSYAMINDQRYEWNGSNFVVSKKQE